MTEYPEFESEADHCVINSMEPPGRFECRNCGAVYTPAMPCPINIYLDIMNGFIRDHRGCELRTTNRIGPAEMPKEGDSDGEMRSQGVPEQG